MALSLVYFYNDRGPILCTTWELLGLLSTVVLYLDFNICFMLVYNTVFPVLTFLT